MVSLKNTDASYITGYKLLLHYTIDLHYRAMIIHDIQSHNVVRMLLRPTFHADASFLTETAYHVASPIPPGMLFCKCVKSGSQQAST